MQDSDIALFRICVDWYYLHIQQYQFDMVYVMYVKHGITLTWYLLHEVRYVFNLAIAKVT